MVPNGWKKAPLANLCVKKISYGIVQTGENIINGIPCLRVSDLPDAEKKSMIRTSAAVNLSYKRTILEKEEIVIALRGEIGLACLVKDDWTGINITRGIARIAPKKDLILPDFLLWELRSPRLRSDLLRRSGGSALQEISIGELRNVSTLVPPLGEQKKISSILSIWDQAITTTENLLTNSQQQKNSLTRELLTGKKRLPGFGQPWKLFKLDQIFSRVTTKNNKRSTNVVTISAQHGLVRQEDFFKKTVASEILDGYFLINKGQFAYNKSHSNGYPMGAIKRLNNYENGVVTTLYICFEVSDIEISHSDFFEHYFEAGLLNKGLSKIANEGGRAHGLLNVKPTDFFGLTVLIPELNEQKLIAQILSTADYEIDILKQKLACLKQEKIALMQELLTGKRRVKVEAA